VDTNKLNEQLNSANSFPASVGGGIAGANTLWLIFYSYIQVLINSAPPPMVLDELGVEIKGTHERCQASPMAGLLYARNAGELLLEAQAKLSPAEWEIWLKANCNLSARTAETYMQMAKGWPGLPKEKSRNVAGESVASSLIASVEEENLAKTKSVGDLQEEKDSELEVIFPLENLVVTEVIEEEKRVLSAEEVENLEIVDVPKSRDVEKRDRELIIFFIPGNVVPKARPRVTGNGTFMPQRYRTWRNMAEVEIYSQLSELNLTIELPIKKASILMRFVGKHRTNSDLDNLAGACLDALTMNGAGVLLDDRISCVSKLSVEYVPIAEKTGVWIEITLVD